MRVGNFFGIPLVVNPFFLLLLFFTALVGRLSETLILFSIVLWHETAHVIAAKYYGLYVREIELLPFGGVARIEELLQLEPGVERSVAIVGPVSNLILLLLVLLVQPYGYIPEDWLGFIVQANIVMSVFNLLPALPLDGGRVFRSILVEKYGFRQATEKAAGIGQVLGIGLIVLGVVGYQIYGYINALVFIVIGFFLLLAARKEKAGAIYIFMRYLTHKQQEIRFKRVLAAKELVAVEETSLGEVFRRLTPSYYHIVWVLDTNGTLLGIITELEMIEAFLEKGIQTKLGELVKYRL